MAQQRGARMEHGWSVEPAQALIGGRHENAELSDLLGALSSSHFPHIFL